MYDTGDIGRLREDGSLEWLGRVDDQVKLRGHRIELDEVAGALRALPEVGHAVVDVHRDERGEAQLTAYLVTDAGRRLPATSELRARLASSLPHYMMPSFFVALDAIPLTSSGKVDRHALRAAREVAPGSDQAGPAPVGHIAVALARLWEEILGATSVGTNDSFFDLGGHSLAAMHLVKRVRHELGCELAVQTIYDTRTLGEMASLLDGGERSMATATSAGAT
jgi:acyl carrier protein